MTWTYNGERLFYNGKVAEAETEEGGLVAFEVNLVHAPCVWAKPLHSLHDDKVRTHGRQAHHR